LQSHAPTQQFNCITPGYTYDQGASMPVAYDYNQEIRTGIALVFFSPLVLGDAYIHLFQE
jgi:hypothetical protein